MRCSVVATSALDPLVGGDPARVRAAVATAAGGYLRNVIRQPGVTCTVCADPVRGFDRCWRCAQLRRVAGVADVVAPLTYAIAGTPSGALLRDYKNHPARKVREPLTAVITWLLWLGLSGHERCVGAAAGMPVSARVVIPSLTCRPGTHPLTEIAGAIGVLGEEVMLRAAPDALCDRVLRPEKFVVTPAGAVRGRHVLVLDDMWTTGSNAQSAALALRCAGAAVISVMVVGRWLNPRYGRTADFIATRLRGDFDPDLCPVTGGSCP